MHKMVTWEYEKRPISEGEITLLENQMGYKLPIEYTEILLSYHGARPNRKMFNTQKSKGRIIKTFLPITQDYKVNVTRVKQWLQLPKIMIPFANTPGGDYICFEFFDENSGPAIILWDHEKREKEYINISFAKFMNSLYSLDE